LLPMFALLAVGAASQFSLRSRRIQLCAWLGAAWLLLVAWRTHPYFIEYFNEFAGGPSNGYQWLVDSNLDWGQGVKRLKHFLDEHTMTNIDLAYFGPRRSIDYCGISGRRVSAGEARGMRSGTLVVSATELMSPGWDWLRASYEPVAQVGFTMFIYRLENAPTRDRWEQILRIRSNDARAYYNLGIVLERAGEIEGAVTHYEQAIRIKPDFAMAHNGLAGALQRAGRVMDAIEQYRQVLRIEPDNAQAYIDLGLALAQMGQGQDAIAQYQQALQLEPDNQNAWIDWGIALQDRARTKRGSEADALLRQAEEKYEQALRINPDLAEAHGNLGAIFQSTGRLPDAAAQYELALRINPDYVEAHFNLGLALEKLGRTPEAIEHYQQALKLRPDFAPAKDALARLGAGQQ